MPIIPEKGEPGVVNNPHLKLLIFLPCLISACSVGYQARGSLSDVPGELRGKGYPGATAGGRFALASSDGRLRCDGIIEPADVSTTPGSCAGERGPGRVRCTDGREIPVEWQATTCRSWQGKGTDEKGNRLEFRVERR